MKPLNHIFLSNRTEQLYEKLKSELFTSVRPMAKRLVIVPSSPMKAWLMLRMARDPDLGVAAGVKIGILEPAIEDLITELNEYGSGQFYLPTPTELSLAIEEVINSVIADGELSDPEWQPLLSYLGISERQQNKLSKQGRNRLAQLATSLAKYFREYGVYGGRMIASWPSLKTGSWQALIWRRLEKVYSKWGYQSRRIDAFQMRRDIDPADRQIHLFGLSYLAPLHFKLFHKIGECFPVNFYLISPCEKFWGDILSDREGYRLTDFHKKRQMKDKEISHLDELLRDTNPLLANFGRLGREMATLLEGVEAGTEEEYLFPFAITRLPQYEELLTGEELLLEGRGELTLLEAIQADITLLRNPETSEGISFDDYDRTVQVHAAPKRSREVEVVYDLIMGILDQHKDTEIPITPSDIFVMAPDISEYAPYIKALFESPESKLDIQLMDHYSPSHQPFVQGFVHLLGLGRGRWEASSLIELFEHPAFRSKHHFSGEDLGLIRRWVSASKIKWGKDEEHRKQIFGRDYEGKIEAEGYWSGTWEHGLGCLLEGLAMSVDEGDEGKRVAGPEVDIYVPLEGIESSKADLLGKVIHLIRSLQADLKVLHDGTEMTLDEWSVYLKCLSEAYFSQRDSDGEIEGVKTISGIIDTIGKASAKLSTAKYPFDSILRQIEELLSSQSGSYKEGNVHSIRFSSLQPMRALPARVVVLMGMNDSEFPRVDLATPLNLLKGNPDSDYLPEQVDYDRYLFLEALLSSRDYFVMTYVSQEPGSPQRKSPSILVGELFEYIDSAFGLSESDGVNKALSSSCLFTHHLQSFNKAYFSSEGPLKSYFSPNYRAAQSFYHPDRSPTKPFMTIQPYSAEVAVSVENGFTLNLKDLTAFGKNPLKGYFKQLGITIPKDRRYSVSDEGELILSHLNRVIVLNKGGDTLSASQLGQSVVKGLIPQGTFNRHAKNSLMNESIKTSKKLNEKGVDTEGLFSVEFRTKYTEPKYVEGTWQLPPLEIVSPLIGRVNIVGRIEKVSNGGIVLYSTHSEGKEFEKLPLLLTLGALIKRYNLPIQAKLLMCKSDTFKEIDHPEGDPFENLSNYLSYYLKSNEQPSPLAPDFIKCILEAGDGTIGEEVENLFEDSFNEIFDPQLNWLWRNCTSRGSLEGEVKSWKDLIHSLAPRMRKKAGKTSSEDTE